MDTWMLIPDKKSAPARGSNLRAAAATKAASNARRSMATRKAKPKARKGK